MHDTAQDMYQVLGKPQHSLREGQSRKQQAKGQYSATAQALHGTLQKIARVTMWSCVACVVAESTQPACRPQQWQLSTVMWQLSSQLVHASVLCNRLRCIIMNARNRDNLYLDVASLGIVFLLVIKTIDRSLQHQLLPTTTKVLPHLKPHLHVCAVLCLSCQVLHRHIGCVSEGWQGKLSAKSFDVNPIRVIPGSHHNHVDLSSTACNGNTHPTLGAPAYCPCFAVRHVDTPLFSSFNSSTKHCMRFCCLCNN